MGNLAHFVFLSRLMEEICDDIDGTLEFDKFF